MENKDTTAAPLAGGPTTIRCTFRPQAWVNDYAIEVDPSGSTTWVMQVATLPEPNSDESDELRQDANAPGWVRAWSGPFEVDYEVVDPAKNAERPFEHATLPEHQARFVRHLNRLIDNDVDPFQESLEGYAAAAAAASMLADWESSDDGTGYLTAEVKRSDVQDVIAILQKWAKTLTDTPAQAEATP